MIRELKDSDNYPKVMLVLSVLTFIFGIASSLIGELFLPFSSAFLAALFLFEKPEKRIFSYLIPITTVVISIAFGGLYNLVSVEYIALALILVLCYRYSLTKAECSIYMTVTIALFVILSLYLGGAKAIDSFSLTEITEYYLDVYKNIKIYVVELLSNYSVTTKDGTVENLMSVENADLLFESVVNSLVSIIGIFSFIICGVAIKVFTALTLKYSKNGILKSFAHFIPSNTVAYIYIILAIISIFATQESIFNIAILNAFNILMAVFAYIGIQYVLMAGKLSQRRTTSYIFLLAGILLLPGVALQILSYLGVWLTIGTNNNRRSITG